MYQTVIFDSLWVEPHPANVPELRTIKAFHSGSLNEFPEVTINIPLETLPQEIYPDGILEGVLFNIADLKQKVSPVLYRTVLCLYISSQGYAVILINLHQGNRKVGWRRLDFGEFAPIIAKVP